MPRAFCLAALLALVVLPASGQNLTDRAPAVVSTDNDAAPPAPNSVCLATRAPNDATGRLAEQADRLFTAALRSAGYPAVAPGDPCALMLRLTLVENLNAQRVRLTTTYLVTVAHALVATDHVGALDAVRRDRRASEGTRAAAAGLVGEASRYERYGGSVVTSTATPLAAALQSLTARVKAELLAE